METGVGGLSLCQRSTNNSLVFPMLSWRWLRPRHPAKFSTVFILHIAHVQSFELEDLQVRLTNICSSTCCPIMPRPLPPLPWTLLVALLSKHCIIKSQSPMFALVCESLRVTKNRCSRQTANHDVLALPYLALPLQSVVWMLMKLASRLSMLSMAMLVVWHSIW